MVSKAVKRILDAIKALQFAEEITPEETTVLRRVAAGESIDNAIRKAAFGVEQWFVLYCDDGPSGPCGQCMSITNPWRKLYVFYDYDEMKDFCQNLSRARLRPRVELVHNVIIKTAGENSYSHYDNGEFIFYER